MGLCIGGYKFIVINIMNRLNEDGTIMDDIVEIVKMVPAAFGKLFFATLSFVSVVTLRTTMLVMIAMFYARFAFGVLGVHVFESIENFALFSFTSGVLLGLAIGVYDGVRGVLKLIVSLWDQLSEELPDGNLARTEEDRDFMSFMEKKIFDSIHEWEEENDSVAPFEIKEITAISKDSIKKIKNKSK